MAQYLVFNSICQFNETKPNLLYTCRQASNSHPFRSKTLIITQKPSVFVPFEFLIPHLLLFRLWGFRIIFDSNLKSSAMAARILANLIVMGSGILGRAVFQAYRQALANASKSGVAQETMQNIRRGSKIMAEPEARQILGVTEHSSWEEVLKKYDNLFEQNAKNGSFYLQSKVHRAKECLEAIYQKNAQGTPDI
ncbi:Mitochondrial import inner membrane translocase subunit tim-16 [Gossypium arboreum]|uniref:Uncharacterized protein n=10 Tax=Gossypium TaxID=3633 RepID=A0ABR0MTU5_GOSAR|nr:mitochondrial import inner membrane translocase subunit PAM16 like 2-like isoform X1 [Gossypium hirsutum]KAG4171187.1 hypothetical protein ERO13_A12G193700v2 [Gossypium hirsutum]KAK5777255.1 hypothetical protein PVK06_045222 [Gossypium arboreum]KHG05655.1 Mitochondrial import inner membrane translocase subunit tim-16 [Gossypium arboreum]TYG90931.1 hypothetical protein ES288_A12G222400v1 [Gossypium darwinii]